MALETVVFQQDPFINYGCKDFYTMEDLGGVYCFGDGNINNNNINNINWISPPSSLVQSHYSNNSSSPEVNCTGPNDGLYAGACPPPTAAPPPAATAARKKRRRVKTSKNKEEVESQRMTHIAVERNRRRQMNDYLAVLRSLMPPSYAQRGDQASIVGGAINYVKELEQLLQFMEARKQQVNKQDHQANNDSPLFADFFTFPQYSTRPTSQNNSVAAEPVAEKLSAVADIEVTMVESHANVKVLSRKQPKQLFKMVSGFQSIGLVILHLNITTVDHRVLYSFNLKVEDDCQLTTVNEIATAVHEMLIMIQEEAIFC